MLSWSSQLAAVLGECCCVCEFTLSSSANSARQTSSTSEKARLGDDEHAVGADGAGVR